MAAVRRPAAFWLSSRCTKAPTLAFVLAKETIAGILQARPLSIGERNRKKSLTSAKRSRKRTAALIRSQGRTIYVRPASDCCCRRLCCTVCRVSGPPDRLLEILSLARSRQRLWPEVGSVAIGLFLVRRRRTDVVFACVCVPTNNRICFSFVLRAEFLLPFPAFTNPSNDRCCRTEGNARGNCAVRKAIQCPNVRTCA